MSNFNLNRVFFCGNLGQNPELRYSTNGTAICNFSIGLNRPDLNGSGSKVDWARIVVFGKSAETAVKYLTKGRKVFVEARFQSRKWEDKDGNTRYSSEFIASSWQFADSKKKESIEDDKVNDVGEMDDLPGEF